ncbi:MAG: lasso peptide biosynthesis B2 protein [Phycisphaera sp.]|nr:lasso peptide biosynthesis B2 protein [Phycisphaera sp.]
MDQVTSTEATDTAPRRSTLGAWVAASPDDRRLATRAALWLVVTRVALAVSGYRGARRVLRLDAARPTLAVDDDGRGDGPTDLPRRVGRAVRAAARRLPGRYACLCQALVAERLLRAAGLDANLSIGVARPGDAPSLRGHAWLTCGATVVVGDNGERDAFTELHTRSTWP